MFNIYDQQSCFVGGTLRRAHCELSRGAEEQPISHHQQADWGLKRGTAMVRLNLSACRLPYSFPLKSRFYIAGFWILCVWSLTFSPFVKKTYIFVSVHFHIERKTSLSLWTSLSGSALDFWPPIVCKTSQTSAKPAAMFAVTSYKVTGGEEERRQRLLYPWLSSYTLPVR